MRSAGLKTAMFESEESEHSTSTTHFWSLVNSLGEIES